MKKTILIFGANGFIAKAFISKFNSIYNILPVYKTSLSKKDLAFDFLSNDFGALSSLINCKIDGVLFLQGLNPTNGLDEITIENFDQMIAINLKTPLFLIKDLCEKFNKDASIVFISSIAKRKGSYDPSYATAKAGLTGLVAALANHFPNYRFNTLSLGLVQDSPVFNRMTSDFKQKHSDRMRNEEFIDVNNVINGLNFLLDNTNINREDLAIDGGYS